MNFRKVDIVIPPQLGCEVVGFLYDSDDPAELGQDMVEVRLPIGITINAGWYPEGSPTGAYRIRSWGQLEFPEYLTRNVDDAREMIVALVGLLTFREPKPISDSFTTVHQQRCYELA